jgi:hypothetical protein
MANYLRFSTKMRAYYNQGEMTAASAARMACVPGAIILDIQSSWLQNRQPTADFIN